MFPASSKQSGQCFAFPDVCKVPAPPAPPVPTPFPNTAQLSMASGGTCSKKVKILNQPIITKKTEIPSTMGDEAGTLKGVVSGTSMKKLVFNKGSTKVKVEGQPIVHLTAPCGHNGAPNANAPGGQQVAPSQSKVLVAP